MKDVREALHREVVVVPTAFVDVFGEGQRQGAVGAEETEEVDLQGARLPAGGRRVAEELGGREVEVRDLGEVHGGLQGGGPSADARTTGAELLDSPHGGEEGVETGARAEGPREVAHAGSCCCHVRMHRVPVRTATVVKLLISVRESRKPARARAKW